jgi:hypothetical protein
MRSWPLAIAVAAVLGITGCAGTGSSATDFEGEEQKVAEVVEELERSAGGRNEADEICREILSDSLREQIEAGGAKCGAEMKLAIEDADDFAFDVEDVSVTGAGATAEVTSGSGDDERTQTFELVKQGKDWRIESFGDG